EVIMNQHSTPDLVEPDVKGSSSGKSAEDDKIVIVVDDEASEGTPLIRMEECRICQEEDSIKNLESPCACIGSLKAYAHRKCVQHWCNEKGDIICEICHQPYQPDYTASPQRTSDETPFNFG
ncbi:zinc finger family protein, partial [Genlisea aurea]